MRALARLDVEVRQAAFDEHLRFGYVAPLHRDAECVDTGAPAAVAEQYVVAAFFAHTAVEFRKLPGYLAGFQDVEGGGFDIDEVAEPLVPAGAESAVCADQRGVAAEFGPVYGHTVAIVGYRPDLQHVEDFRTAAFDVEVGGEFYLHAAFHLLLGYAEQGFEYVGKREGVVLEYMRKSDDLGAFGVWRADELAGLVVEGRGYVFDVAEAAGIHYVDALEVYRVVQRGLEFLRIEVQGEHRVLGLLEGEGRRGGLQYVVRVARREAQHLFAVHDCLAQAVGDLGYAFLRLFVAYGVEVQRTGDAGKRREEVALVLAAAYLLYHYGHFLLRDDVRRGEYISTRRGEVNRGIYALYGLAEQAELLVLVFGGRNHIG